MGRLFNLVYNTNQRRETEMENKKVEIYGERKPFNKTTNILSLTIVIPQYELY